MKVIKYISCLILTAFLFYCSGNLAPVSDDDIVNYTGTIMEVDGYLIKLDIAYQGNINLFYPSNLPENYKISGLRVMFSGELIECPPNAYCYAQEIKLSAIRVIDEN